VELKLEIARQLNRAQFMQLKRTRLFRVLIDMFCAEQLSFRFYIPVDKETLIQVYVHLPFQLDAFGSMIFWVSL
jgi:hypothetical protein